MFLTASAHVKFSCQNSYLFQSFLKNVHTSQLSVLLTAEVQQSKKQIYCCCYIVGLSHVGSV